MNYQTIREQLINNILKDIQEEIDVSFILSLQSLPFPTLAAAIAYIKDLTIANMAIYE